MTIIVENNAKIMNSTDQPRTGNPGCYSQGKDYVYKLIETKSIAC